MKKLACIIILLGIVGCEQQKIGYVDNVKLMEKYENKIKIEANFKSKRELLNKRRDSISQQFQQEAQAFQQKAEGMPQNKAQEEYGLLQQRGQMIGQQLQQEEQQLQLEGQTEMDSLVSKVKASIEKYGKDNGYTYILGGGEGGSVLYGDDSRDLTEEIVQILNSEKK